MSAQSGLGREAGALERATSEDAEEASDLVEPGRARRREVEDDARVGYEPILDLGRLVSRRVVENDVQLTLAERALEPSQEAE